MLMIALDVINPGDRLSRPDNCGVEIADSLGPATAQTRKVSEHRRLSTEIRGFWRAMIAKIRWNASTSSGCA